MKFMKRGGAKESPLNLSLGSSRIGSENSMRRRSHRMTDTGGWDPTWSPDGRRVLFASDLGGSAQLWVVGVDGSGLHQVSNLPAIRGRRDWSPDGSYIV